MINAERQDRGLGALKLDTTLLSQIDLNHSKEMAQYSYFDHPSPINQAGPNANPAIKDHWRAYGVNISGGGNAASSIYGYMYKDKDQKWGHRQNILGYIPQLDTSFGHYTWVGIGNATGGKYGFYNSLDFLEDFSSTPYTPPSTADTQAPGMSPPTIVDANTVQVTNVQDDSDGSSGAAGVTGVVFYVGAAVDSSGKKFQTVAAKQTARGTWTATVSGADPTTLHAVAVDGSGNYNDCAASASSC